MTDNRNKNEAPDNKSFEEQTYEFARQWKRQFSRRDFLKLAGMVGGTTLFQSMLANKVEAAPSVTPSARPVAQGEPKQGGVITIARISDSDTLDPQKSTLLAAHEIMTQIYDPLIYLDGAGNVFPALAESWEFSNDNKTLTFKLRQGVTFHDGSPLNAETVKWTVERQLSPEVASPTAWMLGPDRKCRSD